MNPTAASHSSPPPHPKPLDALKRTHAPRSHRRTGSTAGGQAGQGRKVEGGGPGRAGLRRTLPVRVHRQLQTHWQPAPPRASESGRPQAGAGAGGPGPRWPARAHFQRPLWYYPLRRHWQSLRVHGRHWQFLKNIDLGSLWGGLSLLYISASSPRPLPFHFFRPPRLASRPYNTPATGL